MLYLHEVGELDAKVLLEKTGAKKELDEITRLAYRAYLEGKGEEAAEIYTAMMLREISREEALKKLKQLLGKRLNA
jgi:hypothetical protein